MSESKIIEILTSYSHALKLNTLFEDIIRDFFWFLIKILVFLSNSIEGFFDAVLSLNGFFASEGISKIFSKFSPVIWLFLAFSITFVGYKIMFDKEFKKDKVFQNTILAIATLVLLPTLMIQLSSMTTSAIKALDEVDNSKVKLSANKIIKDNLYDLYYLDSFNFNGKNLKNNINEKDIDYIDIHETIDESKVKNKDVFQNRISTDENSKKGLKKLDNGFFDVIKEKYYRFSLDYIVVVVTLLCNAAVLLFASIKMARLFIELAVGKLLALLMATSDIGNGQKTKEIIKYLVNIFIVIFTIPLMMKIYLLFSVYIESKDFPTIYNVILLCVGAWSVIDGANIIERILGIDAGVKDGHSFVMGGFALAKTIGATATTLSKVSKDVSNKVSQMSGFGVGALSGAFSKGGKLSQDMKLAESSGGEKSNNESLSSQMKNSEVQSRELKRDGSDNSTVNKDDKHESNINENNNESSYVKSYPSEEISSSSGNLIQDTVNMNHPTEENNMNMDGAEQSSANMGNVNSALDMDNNKFPVEMNDNENKYKDEKANRPNYLGNQAHRVVDPSVYGLDKSKNEGLKIDNKEGIKNDGIPRAETLGSQMKSILQESNQDKVNLSNPTTSSLENKSSEYSNKNISSKGVNNVESKNSNNSSNNNKIRSTDNIVESRHIGQYVKDKIESNPNVQATKKSYELGKNTGENLKNNINKIRNFARNK